VNKKQPHWKLPAWFAGCQPECLAAPGGPAGLRAATGAVLAGPGLASALSWWAAVKAGGCVASRESLFRNKGEKRNKMHFLLEQERL